MCCSIITYNTVAWQPYITRWGESFCNLLNHLMQHLAARPAACEPSKELRTTESRASASDIYCADTVRSH